MAGYVAIFAPKNEGAEDYASLLNVIRSLTPGPTFGVENQAVPYAVFFHSSDAPEILLGRLREHLYEGDEVVLLRVTEGIGVLVIPESQQQFRRFLSGL